MSDVSSRSCTGCGETKPLDQFARLRHGKYGRRSWCRLCTSAKGAAYHAATPRGQAAAAARDADVLATRTAAHKTCTECSQPKPFADFRPRASGRYGCRSKCLACESARRAVKYAANPGPAKAASAAFHAENRERSLAVSALRRESHREEARQTTAAWRAANPERTKRAIAAWQAAHPERVKAVRHAVNMARREWISTPGAPSVATLVAILCDACVYCGGEAAEWDHVLPRRLGGLHVESNIVASCKDCNRGPGGKFARLLTEWDPVKVQRAIRVSPKVAAEYARQVNYERKAG